MMSTVFYTMNSELKDFENCKSDKKIKKKKNLK